MFTQKPNLQNPSPRNNLPNGVSTSQTPTYTLQSLIDIRFADPISAIALTSSFIVTGTMMGRITLYSIKDSTPIHLAELSSENISDISYDPPRTFYIGIGDEEILRCDIDINNINNNPNNNVGVSYNSTRIKVYKDESEHTRKCENSFTMLHKSNMFKLQLAQPEEGNVNIVGIDAEYVLRNIASNEINNNESELKLKMTNYSVPLDFKEFRFVWVEYWSDVDRYICVCNLNGDVDNPFKYKITKQNKDKSKRQIGHISYCKLLRNNKLFIVHSLNKCEIVAMNEELTVLKSFEHIGDEVYAVDIYYDDVEDFNMNNNNNNVYEHSNTMHLNNNNNIQNNSTSSNNINAHNLNTGIATTANNNNNNNATIDIPNNNSNNNNNGNVEDEFLHLSICLLDIDGNVNIWENNKIRKEFNLYDIKEIIQDHKDKQFFSMGYSYYIRYNKDIFAISSDHGCYIITKNYMQVV